MDVIAKSCPGTDFSFQDISRQKLAGLGDEMKKRLVGQDNAVDVLVNAIQKARVGLKDPEKPIGSFFFFFFTGMGKTYAAKTLTESLLGDTGRMITIDCTEYATDHEYQKLIGAPPGYVGCENGGMLTNALMNHPFCVVLFDEVEKASYKLHQLLLQIMDEGRLTDGAGSSVSFRESILIFTSNIGVQQLNESGKKIGFNASRPASANKPLQSFQKALKAAFKPELLNRMDSIIHFRDLAQNDYKKIIDLELNRLGRHLKNSGTEFKDLELVFEDSLKDYLSQQPIAAEYGARALKRCINLGVTAPLTQKLLSIDPAWHHVVKMSAEKGKIRIDIEKRHNDISNQEVIDFAKLFKNDHAAAGTAARRVPQPQMPAQKVYINRCWHCGASIDSRVCLKDPGYGYVCNQCGKSLRHWKKNKKL